MIYVLGTKKYTPVKLTVSHVKSEQTISIKIVKTADSSAITSGTLSGAATYATMTSQNYDFTFNGESYALTCTVAKSTTPFFTGSITRGSSTVASSITGGDGGTYSSVAWSFTWEGVI